MKSGLTDWIRSSREHLLPLACVAIAQVLACTLASRTGFVAISDDDYARVVIAQRWVEAPSADPTQTSWLPFPFYATGSFMALFGATLDVARTAQVLWAVLASALLYAASLALGARRLFALGGAIFALSATYPATLSIATVPEYPTACLIAFGLAAATRIRGPGPDSLRWALLGAIALMIATGCRYEAWPAAAGYSGLVLIQARGGARSRLTLGAIALVSSSFIGLWLLHGIFVHGSAFFFVTRVVSYKEALGAPPPPLLDALQGGYLKALIASEPVLLLAPLLPLGLLVQDAAGRQALKLARLGGPALLATLILATLVIGDVRNGAPTHHPERALLGLWLFGGLCTAFLTGLWLSRAPRSNTSKLALGLSLLVLVGTLDRLRPPPPQFSSRQLEEQLGRTIKNLTLAGAVALDTPDYGYFAIQAAAGRPGRFIVLDTHDPRSPNQQRALGTARTDPNVACIVTGADTPIDGFTRTRAAGHLALYRRD